MDQQLRARALSQPTGLAIECGRAHWTYRQLDGRADALAAALLARGLKRGDRVGLVTPHGPEMVAAMLACMRIKATYVPIDPSWPLERARVIVADVEPAIVVVDASIAAYAQPFDARRLVWDFRTTGPAVVEAEHGSEAPAYILFTSGSTGRPKGVIQSRHGMLAHVETYARSIELTPSDRVSALASYTFDASIMDIFGTLTAGATLCIYDPRRERLSGVLDWLGASHVSVCHLTPTLLRAMLMGITSRLILPALRCVVLGGESVFGADVKLHRRLIPRHVALINGYGPTECTLAAQQVIDCAVEPTAEAVPIGRPVAGVEILLRASDGTSITGDGVGEIVLRGERVALGYWNAGASEMRKFGRDPTTGARTYATGDLAVRRSDGAFIHLGRIDEQVKVNGCRIELNEVEAHLMAMPGIRLAAVAVRDEGRVGSRLMAWFVPEDSRLPPQDVRCFLRERLPASMVPTTIAAVESLPMLTSGKVDRRALLQSIESAGSPPDGSLPLRRLLSEIWRKTLSVTSVGTDENFFALGGDSLQALAVDLETQAALGGKVPSVFRYPTIGGLARKLRGARRQGTSRTSGISSAPSTAPLSPPQRRYWARLAPERDASMFHIGLVLDIEGALESSQMVRAFAEVVRQNDVLRAGIELDENGPMLVASATVPVALRVRKIPIALNDGDWRHMIDRLAIKLMRRPFKLTRPGLLRAQLVSRTAESHALVLSFHHLIMDGWARRLFETALFREYARELSGFPPRVDFAPSYLSASVNMDDRGNRSNRVRKLRSTKNSAWQFDRKSIGQSIVRLPYDNVGRGAVRRRTSTITWEASPEVSSAVFLCARAFRCSPFSVVTAVFNIALAWWTNAEIIITTTDRVNRNASQAEVIGLFSDVLPLSIVVNPSERFGALVRRVHRQLSEAQRQESPHFANFVEQKWPDGLSRYDEIFPIAIALEEEDNSCRRPGNLIVRTREVGSGHLSRDLVIVATKQESLLTIRCHFRAWRLRRGDVAKLMRAIQAICLAATSKPEGSVHEYLTRLGAAGPVGY